MSDAGQSRFGSARAWWGRRSRIKKIGLVVAAFVAALVLVAILMPNAEEDPVEVAATSTTVIETSTTAAQTTTTTAPTTTTSTEPPTTTMEAAENTPQPAPEALLQVLSSGEEQGVGMKPVRGMIVRSKDFEKMYFLSLIHI